MDRRLAASAVVLALVVGGCDAATPPSASAPTSTTAPSAVATPAPTVPPPTASPAVPALREVIPPNASAPSGLGLTWSRAYIGTGHGPTIARGPYGWAFIVTHDEGRDPTVRVSVHLESWDASPLDARAGGGGMAALAASRDRYVLAGGTTCLSSPDARQWTECTIAGSEDPLGIGGVASDGHTFVAWQTFHASAHVWASTDGRTWSAVELPDATAVIVDAVSARPGGGYVLAGRAGASAAELDRVEGPAVLFAARPGTQAVWTSANAFSWARVPLGAGFEAVRFLSIAAGGPGGGIVAVGPGLASCGPGTAAPVCGANVSGDLGIEPDLGVWRWTEEDGWQRLRGQGFPVVERSAGVTRILATESRWLLIGSRLQPDATFVLDTTSPGVLAGSDDGTAWWAVGTVLLDTGAPRADYAIDAVAVSNRIVFVVNWSGPGIGDDTVEVWTSPAFELPLD